MLQSQNMLIFPQYVPCRRYLSSNQNQRRSDCDVSLLSDSASQQEPVRRRHLHLPHGSQDNLSLRLWNNYFGAVTTVWHCRKKSSARENRYGSWLQQSVLIGQFYALHSSLTDRTATAALFETRSTTFFPSVRAQKANKHPVILRKKNVVFVWRKLKIDL